MWSRFQTGVRGNQAGYLQAWPGTWTRDYWEQIQLAVRAGLELGASNPSATLPRKQTYNEMNGKETLPLLPHLIKCHTLQNESWLHPFTP